jgi:hypothetical protein
MAKLAIIATTSLAAFGDDNSRSLRRECLNQGAHEGYQTVPT